VNINNIIYNQQQTETNLNYDYRKDFGIFLTSDIDIIDDIISIINLSDNNILNKKFLEPSCGDGILIISILVINNALVQNNCDT